jgi:hypothetical protein
MLRLLPKFRLSWLLLYCESDLLRCVYLRLCFVAVLLVTAPLAVINPSLISAAEAMQSASWTNLRHHEGYNY